MCNPHTSDVAVWCPLPSPGTHRVTHNTGPQPPSLPFCCSQSSPNTCNRRFPGATGRRNTIRSEISSSLLFYSTGQGMVIEERSLRCQTRVLPPPPPPPCSVNQSHPLPLALLLALTRWTATRPANRKQRASSGQRAKVKLCLVSQWEITKGVAGREGWDSSRCHGYCTPFLLSFR